MTARSNLRFSLQHKVVLAVVSCVIAPVAVLGAYFFKHSEAVLREKARETLSNSLFRKTAEVEGWMAERMREATRWSTSFIVFEAVEALRAGGEQPRARADLHDYLVSILGHYRVYESLLVMDLDGNILSATAEEEIEPWARELLRAQVGGTGAVITPIRRSERLGRPTMLVFHVLQGRSDRPVGYLGQHHDLRELSASLAASSPTDATGFWLLDAEGGVVIQYGRLLDDPGAQRFPAPVTEPMGEGDLPGVGETLWGIHGLKGLPGRARGRHGAGQPGLPAAGSSRTSSSPLITKRAS